MTANFSEMIKKYMSHHTGCIYFTFVSPYGQSKADIRNRVSFYTFYLRQNNRSLKAQVFCTILYSEWTL